MGECGIKDKDICVVSFIRKTESVLEYWEVIKNF